VTKKVWETLSQRTLDMANTCGARHNLIDRSVRLWVFSGWWSTPRATP